MGETTHPQLLSQPANVALRPDVAALLEQHVATAPNPTNKRIEADLWAAYRQFREALHGVCGCGALREQQDHGEFMRAIRLFCEAMKL
jgi:hypothetical protein